MAAGMGSRYGGLKQLDPVGPSGEVIMDYSIYDALQAGFSTVVFVIRKDIEQAFREHLGNRIERVMNVEYAFQELHDLPDGFSVPAGRTKPWGTAHAILSASACIRDSFGVINADDFYGRNSYMLLADHLRNADETSMDFALIGFRLANTLSEHGSVARGVCTLSADEYLIDVVEHTDIKRDDDGIIRANAGDHTSILAQNCPVSMNMWGFTPMFFKQGQEAFRRFLEKHGSGLKSEYYIPTLVDEWITNKTCSVKVIQTSSSWFGVTYSADKPAVVTSIRKLIDQGDYPETLWS